ncbi:MAG: gliding motility-associated C-terminal domain-containing protein [Bacteroidota bacterium]
MKQALTFLFCFLYFYKMYAQANLVPNPSFEDTINCPTNIGQINNCAAWYNPNTGSPDYFNSCAFVITDASVPTNAFGYQYPRTGNAYAGLYVYQDFMDVREYIQVQLINALKEDSTYCVSFYVCLDNYSNTAITQIGLYFSNNSITKNDYYVFNVIPHIISPTSQFLDDTTNWVEVSSLYTAQGGESYITIGNFKTDANTDTISWDLNNPNCFPFCYPKSHYYIDDVSVLLCNKTVKPGEKSSNITVPNIFSPNNDGTNDVFIMTGENIESFNCKIYNRWGILIKELRDVDEAWDGRTTAGLECSTGTYYYILNAKGMDNKEYKEKGFIQLIAAP